METTVVLAVFQNKKGKKMYLLKNSDYKIGQKGAYTVQESVFSSEKAKTFKTLENAEKFFKKLKKGEKMNEILGKLRAGGTKMEKEIIDIIDYNVDSAEDLIPFLEDTTTHGCVQGGVSKLIYFQETHDFFKRHVDEILDRLFGTEEGEYLTFKKNEDKKNKIVWWIFEETCHQILTKIEDIRRLGNGCSIRLLEKWQ